MKYMTYLYDSYDDILIYIYILYIYIYILTYMKIGKFETCFLNITTQ